MRFKAAWAGALLMGAVSAGPAQGQINYFTQGFFANGNPLCNQAVVTDPALGPLGSSCAMAGGFTLTYSPKALNPRLIGSGSVVNLGNFALVGAGNIGVPSGPILFTLAIQQTNPVTGTGSTVGSISGTVWTNPDFSALIWTPTPSVVNIGGVSYNLIFDGTGPAAAIGYAIGMNNPANPTSIQAQVTVTPEPACLTLLATGLVGIFGAARRRRKARRTRKQVES